MNTVERINKAFERLKKDCINVALVGFVNKSEIPSKASREEYDDSEFDHEFSITYSDGWDEGGFYGNIYLPLEGDLYMNFSISS